MTKQKAIPSVLALLLLLVAVACSQPGSSPAAPAAATAGLAAQNDGANAATIEFGRDTLGSPFPPPSGHDQSGHSRDSLFPQTVVINKGGTVTFVMGVSGVHEVAIYRPGTEPSDINTQLLSPAAPGCPPVPTINDSHNRIAIVADQHCEGGPTQATWTFNTPGKYLVICTFLPHFQVGMYGYITVKDK